MFERKKGVAYLRKIDNLQRNLWEIRNSVEGPFQFISARLSVFMPPDKAALHDTSKGEIFTRAADKVKELSSGLLQLLPPASCDLVHASMIQELVPLEKGLRCLGDGCKEGDVVEISIGRDMYLQSGMFSLETAKETALVAAQYRIETWEIEES